MVRRFSIISLAASALCSLASAATAAFSAAFAFVTALLAISITPQVSSFSNDHPRSPMALRRAGLA